MKNIYFLLAAWFAISLSLVTLNLFILWAEKPKDDPQNYNPQSQRSTPLLRLCDLLSSAHDQSGRLFNQFERRRGPKLLKLGSFFAILALVECVILREILSYALQMGMDINIAVAGVFCLFAVFNAKRYDHLWWQFISR